MHTNGIFDAETIQLGLGQSAPNLRLVDLVCILHTTIEGNHMFDQNIDGLSVLIVLLVDHERLFIQPVLGSDLWDLGGIVILQFVDVADDLPFVRTDSGEKQEVLEVAVVAEGRRFDDDLFQQFDEFKGKVSLDEGMDGDGDIVRVGTFWQYGGNNLGCIDQSTASKCIDNLT